MNDKELNTILANIKAKMAAITTKEQALAHLIKAGIATPTGKLTIHYKDFSSGKSSAKRTAKDKVCIQKEPA